MMWYDALGNPAAVFDGWEMEVGGIGEGSMFYRYDPIVASHVPVPSPLELSALYSLDGLVATINVRVTVTDTVTTPSNQIEFVVVEDGAHDGVNLARDVLASEPFTLTLPGQSLEVTRQAGVHHTWVLENVRFIVFVQSRGEGKEVLQANQAAPDSAVFVEVVTEPDSLYIPWSLAGPAGLAISGRGDDILLLPDEGSYTLTWQTVPYWSEPQPATINAVAAEGDTLTFAATYTDPPFTTVQAGPLGDSGPGRSVSCVDFDTDGDLDIYVVNHQQPNLLLRNDGGLTFVDVATWPLADWGPGGGAVWADFDNDGDPDVYLTRPGLANALLQNEAGHFTDVTVAPLDDAGPGVSAAWADFDHNGFLDLYLVNDDEPDCLFAGYGEIVGMWVWLSQATGLGHTGPGRNAGWADYDNDGDADLFLTNHGVANKLFRNQGPLGFEDATGLGFLADQGNGAGVAWGDLNNDGWLDLYFTNDGQPDVLAQNGGGMFCPLPPGNLGDPANGQAVNCADFDNDGDLDLFVGRCGQMDFLLVNNGGWQFARSVLVVPGTDGCSTSAACGDFDADGDIDIYVLNPEGPNLLLVNEINSGNHWLQVGLQGTDSNGSALGARLRLVAGGMVQYREIAAGNGNFSQDSPLAAFGLGAAAVVDTLEVRWPSGLVQAWAGFPADQVLRIREGDDTSLEDQSDPEGQPQAENQAPPGRLGLHPCFPNPFNPGTTISFSLARSRRVKISVLDLAGRQIAVVASREFPPGSHSLTWNGCDLAGRSVSSGTYLVRMETEDRVEARKIVLAR